jgi:hypothetical protein
MICFTDWLPLRSTRELCGWSMVALMVFNILFNLRIIFSIIGKSLLLICKRYKNYLGHVVSQFIEKWWTYLLAKLWSTPPANGSVVEPPRTGAKLTRFRLPF